MSDREYDLMDEGSYGIVYRTKDEEGNGIAIKEFIGDPDIDFLFNIVELDMFYKLKKNEYILNLKAYSFEHPLGLRKYPRMDSLYFTFELADSDLYNMFEQIPPNYTKYRDQLIQGVYHLHKHRIMHRDIKLENILYFSQTDTVKICDFGMCKRYVVNDSNTMCVATPNYRAPEIYLEDDKYDLKSDVFSLGVLLYELYHRRIFESPKNSYRSFTEMLRRVLDEIDIEKLIKRFPKSKILKNKSKLKQISLLKRNNVFNLTDNEDLMLSRMITLYPENRCSIFDLFGDQNEDKDDVKPIEGQVTQKEEMKKIFCNIYNKLKGINYFNFKILFMTLDIVYKYILSENKDDLLNVILSSLYLCIKNCNTFNNVSKFGVIVKMIDKNVNIDMKYFEKLEKNIISVALRRGSGIFNYTIYDHSLEADGRLNDDILLKLMKFYIDNDVFIEITRGNTLNYFYEKFKNEST